MTRTRRTDSGLHRNDFGYNLRSEVTNAVMRVVGQTTNTYAYAYDPIGNRLSASRNLDDLTYVSNEQTLEPTYDVTEYVNASGTTVAHYEYDPFGGISRQTGALADEFPHRFSTKYLDSETGLVYYGYRYYSPELGRWTSRDPIGERGGHNLFVSMSNDAVSRRDILGQRQEDIEPRADAAQQVVISRLAHSHGACCVFWRPDGGTMNNWMKTFLSDGCPAGLPKHICAHFGTLAMEAMGIAGDLCYGATFTMVFYRSAQPTETADAQCASGRRYSWEYGARLAITEVESACCRFCYSGSPRYVKATPSNLVPDLGTIEVKGGCVGQ
jgi:RHS repeat-associated protein